MFKSFGSMLSDNNDPLVRMFRIEYAKEHRDAVRNGHVINSKFVQKFLETSKI